MNNVVELKNVSYKELLKSVNFEIKSGEFVSLVGCNGSGKSTIVKFILGLNHDYNGSISVFGKQANKNRNEILSHIGVVFESISDTYVADKVSDEIVFSLKNMNMPSEEINSRLLEISEYLNIQHLLDCMPQSLSGGEKQLIALASALIIYPEFLIIDQSLDMIDSLQKEKILSLLKKIHKDKKMTILYLTHDLEDALYTDRILLLSNGEICLDDKTKNSFINDKVFLDAGLSLPFMVDLCKKLQYYDLVDKVEFNMDKLVNKLWK